MSKLLRMNIRGIRSFGPDEEDLQDIKFQSPLTLIQGQNGSGKTSIIEALKFAITGDVPGGSSLGQGFVYDPKLARSYETRGQIKLRVSDVKTEWVTVTKSVSVTQRANNKLQFKRLDSTISRGKGGNDPHHFSGKCADIDNEMCRAMGVSKPVLNNVIFCHQEDSNWPLEESKKLKARFDEIFDATRYNKCLEHTNKYVKKLTAEQKLLQIGVEVAAEKRKYVENRRTVLAEKELKLETISADIEEINGEFAPLNARLEEIRELEASFNKLQSEAEFKRKELEHLKQQQREILQNTKEFQGTDEELEERLANFQTELANIQTSIDALERKKTDVEKTEANFRKDINVFQKKLGELQSEENQNQEKVQRRNKLVNEAAKEYKLKTGSVEAAIPELKLCVNDSRNKAQELESALEGEEKMLQDEIDKIREELAQVNQDIHSRNRHISDFREELRQVQRKLLELDTADEQLKLVDGKLNRLNRELEALQTSVNPEALRASIEAEKRKCTDLEGKLTEVDREIQSLQHFAALQTELDVKRETSITKQNELQKLRNKHEATLSQIFRERVPEDGVKNGVEDFQRTQSRLVKDLQKSCDEKQRKLMQLETKLSSLKDKLAEKQKELEYSRSEISKHCGENSLEEIITGVNTSLKELQNDRGVYFSSKYLYQKFIDQFEREEPCPLCKRRVEEKRYTEEIITDLKKKIENFPAQLEKINADIAEKEGKVQKLLGLRPLGRNQATLAASVAELRNELSRVQVDLDKCREEFSSGQRQLEEPRKNEEMAAKLVGDAALIDQLARELGGIKRQIEGLQGRMPQQQESSRSRGMQEALSEQETLRLDAQSSRSATEALQNKLMKHTDRVQKIREEVVNLVRQQLDIKKSLQDKAHLVTKREEADVKITALELEIAECKTQIDPQKEKLKRAETRKEEQRVSSKKRLQETRNRLGALQNCLSEITTLEATIETFQLKNIAGRIQEINRAIEEVQEKLEELTKTKGEILSGMDSLKESKTNSWVVQRQLQDNVNLREKRRQSSELQGKLKVLEEKLGGTSMPSILEEKNRLLDQGMSLREEKHKAQGKRQEISGSIAELRLELKEPQNANAAHNYKAKWLAFTLKERMVVDLKEFVKAMEWALLQFHKQRMKRINSTIKQLWGSIYRGNDIDYIEIKTEDRLQGTDRRKVYEYKVVQVKNRTELDMRGRCSAGQRVLASLIIRIALAETFSVNCGILALDEPTTNLDRENVNSLCEALLDLINQRKQQKNFQLLVITHDHDFVDKLTRVESLESYYVVKRNESGKSVITAQTR